MKTRVHIHANVNGMYRFPLGEAEVEGDIFDFRSLVLRAEVTGEQAEILADALSKQHVSYVNVETHIIREESIHATHTN